VRLPLKNPFPATERVANGEVVPMPMLPTELMRIASIISEPAEGVVEKIIFPGVLPTPQTPSASPLICDPIPLSAVPLNASTPKSSSLPIELSCLFNIRSPPFIVSPVICPITCSFADGEVVPMPMLAEEKSYKNPPSATFNPPANVDVADAEFAIKCVPVTAPVDVIAPDSIVLAVSVPRLAFVAKRLVLDAVVAKEFVVVAAVPVVFAKVKFWRVDEPVRRRLASVERPVTLSVDERVVAPETVSVPVAVMFAAVRLPLKNPFPATERVANGEVVPMPMLPPFRTVNRVTLSFAFVPVRMRKLRGTLPVVIVPSAYACKSRAG